MVDRRSTSLEQHLRDERAAYANLALLNIQLSALLDRFYREWRTLESKRQMLIDELEHHSRVIREHRRHLELTLFPPEVRAWVQAALPEEEAALEEDDTKLDAFYEPFSDTLCSNLPATGKTRVVFEEAITRQVVCWEEMNGAVAEYRERPAPSRLTRVSPQPGLLLHSCFLPYRRPQTAELCRRAVGGDVVVMKSPEPSVGRVLVSMHVVHRGDTIMVETPLFTSPTTTYEGDCYVECLPPAIRDAMNVVLHQSNVFAAQGWDTRLIRPFYEWLTELVFGEKRDEFAQRWEELGCPVEDADPTFLSKLSDLAHFLWMSLPFSLSSVVASEERVLLFFVALITNAMSYGGGILAEEDNVYDVANGLCFAPLEARLSIFGGISLIEHSCQPNAVLVFRHGCAPESTVFAELRATRTIAIGERITIAYLPTFLPREDRQKQLRGKFFFSCACEQCTTGFDTTRMMLASSESREERVVMCPKGHGAEWTLWMLSLHPSVHGLRELGKSYRYDDAHVLDAIHDEAVFREELNTTDMGSLDALALNAEVQQLTEVLHGEAKSRIVPLHHLFLLRALQMAAVTKSNFSQFNVDTTESVLVFICELLQKLAEIVFVLPNWFTTELLRSETPTGVLSDDLGDRLLESGSNRRRGGTRQPWQERLTTHSLLHPHATLLVSLLEYYAALREKAGNIEAALNAWTACVILLRYGMCQGASERCLKAQLKALQCRQRQQQPQQKVSG
ncbi:putative SET and MYND domain-containing protein 1 isoform X2 [Trypanosoma rangeli]|uniref:Putative SET and MYND domain-containing protein 1 isoform X2 n=1 Tax=Trypanosoma rangeli TaxID=5698 RepID=A0A422P152_TRYRA|nr:putative SET and MYND domain-containing protein 1 isoform X2 [Trypanosoma rangeli]RNF11438.1 putative SET and MYND domain-containing protein 1 isoform X2 [Trypanosoma rangeli]|eukprot:RNF11438.1 putative SET and MYND domain-containing protein 1 isoform X2 [Trypanosoma rangeli]